MLFVSSSSSSTLPQASAGVRSSLPSARPRSRSGGLKKSASSQATLSPVVKALPATAHSRAPASSTAQPREDEPSEECRQILEGRYVLDEQQRAAYDNFTGMLADFDLYMMVNILEDALRDAQQRTMLSDYSQPT